MRTSASPVTVLSAGDRRSRPERGKQLKVSNRLSTCHKTKQVRLLKSRVRILLSTDNSYPLPYIFSGLFSCCKCHLGSHKATKKLLRGAGREKNKRCRESHKREKSVGSEVRRAGGLTPSPKDTGGEVGGLAEKLIQLGRTSQQRHVGFQRSTPSSEKAPFSRS